MAGVWSLANDALNARRYAAGFGAQSATIMASGQIDGVYSKTCEEFDGTDWATINDLLWGRWNHTGYGTALAGIIAGGYNSSTTNYSYTHLYNGTSWSEAAEMLTRRSSLCGFGIQNAGLVTSGSTLYLYTQKFDGDSWAWGPDTPYGPGSARCSTMGTLLSSIVFGGGIANSELNTSLEFDGTSWSYGGDLLQASRNTAGFSVKDSAVLSGHYTSDITPSPETEQYDGTSWSYQGDHSIHRYAQATGGGAWAGVAACGNDEFTATVICETYTDGTDPPPPPTPAIAIQEEIEILEYISLVREVFGSITCGHITDVIEDNIFKFADFVRGTASITGTGDSERLVLSTGKEMISETFELGEGDCKIDQNKYGSGQEGTIYYRTAATRTACDAAGWTEYTGPFTSLGFVGFKVTI